MKDNKKAYIILITLLILLSFASLLLGSVKTDFSNTSLYIITKLRLPRAIGAILTGAVLACCGVLFQIIFRNPMADSYVLGLSSASSCAVSIAVALGVSLTSEMSIYAMTGSLICCFVLFLSSKKSYETLLLTGIALNFLLSALTTLFIYLSKNNSDTVIYWTMGSLENLSFIKNAVLLAICILLITITRNKDSVLDIMSMDDSSILSLGINATKQRLFFILLAAMATSVTVSFCGIIGFIGLMSPHFIKQCKITNSKSLIPLSMLTGSNLLLLSDIISRTIISPSQLPVGIVTSILGAPAFFIILKRRSLWK